MGGRHECEGLPFREKKPYYQYMDLYICVSADESWARQAVGVDVLLCKCDSEASFLSAHNSPVFGQHKPPTS
jgi:hypothetical protein